MKDLCIEILEFTMENYELCDAKKFKNDYDNNKLSESINFIFKEFYHENTESLFNEYNDFLECTL